MPGNHYQIAVLGSDLHAAATARECASLGYSTVLICDQDIGQSGGFNLPLPLNCNLTKLEHLALPEVARNIREEKKLASAAAPWVTPCRYYVAPAATVRTPRRLQLGLSAMRRLFHPPADLPVAPADPAAALLADDAPGEYHTYRLNDQRLLVACVRAFVATKGRLLCHSPLVNTTRNRVWHLQTTTKTITADALINCSGTNIQHTLNHLLKVPSRCAVVLYQQTVMLVEKHYAGNHGYILQTPDKHFVYATPLDSHTLALGPVHRTEGGSAQELVECYNRFFARPLQDSDILEVQTRQCAAYDDPSQKQPDYTPKALLDLHSVAGHAPLLSLFGTDTTKHILLAERAMAVLAPCLPRPLNKPAAQARLPGADITNNTMPAFLLELQAAYHKLPGNLVHRLAFTYGQDTYALLADTKDTQALGRHFGHGLYEREVKYLLKNEWVTTSSDILRRRTRLDYLFTAEQKAALTEWLNSQR